MNTESLLDWYNVIFLGPFVVAAVLLVLTSLRFGGHHGHNSVHAPTHTHSPLGSHPHPHIVHSTVTTKHSGTHQNHPIPNKITFASVLGIDKAPALVVLEFFLLAYGLIGILINSARIHTEAPSTGTIIISFVGAVICGALIARACAGIIGKVLPQDETSAISRIGLFGMTGEVAYPVTEYGGRIHIYDDFGTMHDEQCFVPPGASVINKGSKAKVVDVSVDGKLIVEETVS